ncbi:MAG TPA: molybdopterin synthase catalytic subunit MoaE [Methylotenera sp.]|jgi:molybdopterin synthase catalytic subunit|nr:molybdopterin synthase catalytic subunit MoaE [Methylotenera sp.]HPV31325.1 molybdopterin synthase catalytic subunit MoaE [Methylotenera sp.]
MTVRVQTQDFDVGFEIKQLRVARPDVGAVVSFVGQVRDLNGGNTIARLTLEHYPGMTEKSLEAIVNQAKSRWNIMDATIIHRVGTLQPLDQIVLVAVSSAHRNEAFSACEFMMDYLKTEAPFWKKEATAEGEQWLEAKETDETARKRWEK